MTITLLAIGKTDNSELNSLISDYTKRLSHYIKFKLAIIPDLKKVKNLSEAQQKEKEGMLSERLGILIFVPNFQRFERYWLLC